MSRPHEMPWSDDAEQSVIGGIMLRGRDGLDQVSDIISEDSFFRHEHRLMWRAIVALSSHGKVFDPLVLGTWLCKRGYAEEMRNGAYAIEIASSTPSSANLRGYAEIVADFAMLRQVAQTGAEITNLALDAGGRSGVEVAGMAQSLVGGLLTGQPCEVRPMVDVMQEAFHEIDAFQERGGGIDGQPTGFEELDELLGGMVPGLYVIAGRPKMGKSTLAQNIAEHLSIRKRQPVLIFSIEMTEKQIAKRIISSIGDVDAARVRDGRLDDVDWAAASDAVRKAKGAPLYIAKPDVARAPNICAQARKQHAKTPLGALVVDYLQLMDLMLARGENESTGYGRITSTLAKLGRELGFPVILLSQLNRDLEKRPNKRPIASDLRSSGSIEQDADAVLAVYRDEEYHANSEWKSTAEILLLLHRHGPPGMVRLRYRGDRYRFESLPFGWEPERPAPKQGKKKSNGFDAKSEAAGA